MTHSTYRNLLPLSSTSLEVDASGITRRRSRERRIRAGDIRRVHVFAGEDGEDCLVIRGPRFRLLHLTRRELQAPTVHAGTQALVDAVRDTAQVDDYVHEYLGGIITQAAS